MASLPADVQRRIEDEVGAVQAASPVGGGCIAHATRVITAGGTFFAKWALGEAGCSFEAEAAGLAALRDALPRGSPDGAPLVIPRPLLAADADRDAPGLLLLDWIETGVPDEAYWARFGEVLAALHRASSERNAAADTGGRYGFDRANVIGRLPQANAWHDAWPAFFRTQRLQPQFARARATRRWEAAWDAPADRLLARLPALLPAHPPPSTLHGDLWSGNALATADGRAALIDPAAYVGHREADLAMTELFGGFNARFYDAYHAAWPLAPGYPERREVYNLYHLVNHLNHFGAGYASGVARILQRFG